MQILEQFKKNYDPIYNGLIEALALVRLSDKVRFHSFFGYLGLLFIDMFPRVTEKLKLKEIEKISTSIKKNETKAID